MTLLSNEKSAEIDYQPRTAVEGEIREFVRRDSANLRRGSDNDSELVANNISKLLQRVAGTSVQEIDFRTADIARTTARARRTHSAGNRRLCPTEPVGNAIDKDLRRKPHPMEKVRRLGDANYRATLNERGSLALR